MSGPERVSLTARQRDFLASYPDEVVVDLVGADDQGVHIYANGELSPAHRELVVPPEGFLDQPLVELADPDGSLDRIPTMLWTEEQIEERRADNLNMLAREEQQALFDLLAVVSQKHPNAQVDWDEVLEVIRRGLDADQG